MSDVVACELASSLRAWPRPSPVEPVDRRRVLMGTAAVIVVVLAVVWLVRLLPDSGVPAVVAVVLGLVVFPVIASPIESFRQGMTGPLPECEAALKWTATGRKTAGTGLSFAGSWAIRSDSCLTACSCSGLRA